MKKLEGGLVAIGGVDAREPAAPSPAKRYEDAVADAHARDRDGCACRHCRASRDGGHLPPEPNWAWAPLPPEAVAAFRRTLGRRRLPDCGADDGACERPIEMTLLRNGAPAGRFACRAHAVALDRRMAALAKAPPITGGW